MERRVGDCVTLKNNEALIFGDYRSKAVVLLGKKSLVKILKILLQMILMGSQGREPKAKWSRSSLQILWKQLVLSWLGKPRAVKYTPSAV